MCLDPAIPARWHVALLLLAALSAASGRHLLQADPAPTPSDVAILLSQRDAITNWDAFRAASSLAGWEDAALTGGGTPVCAWGGVRCNGEGNITSLDLSCTREQLQFCGEKAQGTLAPQLSLIRSLNTISIANQSLTGSLPAEWGTSSIGFIYLQDNNLTGTLPLSWGEAGAMPELASMDLSANKLSGPLPDAWGKPGALPKLVIMALVLNQLSGPLPASWASLPSLSRLALGGNELTGSLPPEWGNQGTFPELEYLAMCCQHIQGTLPEQWANGFKKLDQLYLEGLQLTGPLPPSWGAPNVFPMLSGLYLSENSFTGTVPASWSASAALPRLIKMEIMESGVCGPVTDKIARAVCGVADNNCVNGSIPCGPPSPSPPTLSPAPLPPGNSSSSAPIGAIVGGVVGGLAFLALLAFLAFRPRKGWLRSQQPGKGALHGAAPYGPGGTPAALMHPRALAAAGGWQASGKELDSFITTSTTSAAAVLGTSNSKGTEGTRGGLPGSSAPATPSLHSLESDALLSLITSRLATSQPRSGPRSAASASDHPGLPAYISQWEVQWEDIRMDTLIGGGSFGMVYAGVWKETPVACKVLIKQGYQGEGSVDAFLLPQDTLRELHEEAAVMAAMRHPNLVNFMGICMVPPCILTELCGKGSLYDVLRQARQQADKAAELTWRRRIEMAVDGATGLLYLHTHNPPIIHRDVKSPNLLVDQAWRVKVADFNLSKLMQQGQESSIVSNNGGATNPIWLAPEILQGQRATAAADVFSFAMVMLELLTWQLPWEGRQPFAIAHLVKNGQRPEVPPRGQLPGPGMGSWAGLEAYCQLMSECWAQDPLQRPAFPAIVPRLRALLQSA